MHLLATPVCTSALVAIVSGQQAVPPPGTHEGTSDCGGVVQEAADLIRRGRFGSEAFGASEHGLTQLYEMHRGCDVAPLLAAVLDAMHEQDGARQLRIAMFYVRKRGDDAAAEHRLQRIIQEYPRYSRMDDVLYELSVIQHRGGRRLEAIGTLSRLIDTYPLSPRIQDASEMHDAWIRER